MHPTSPAAPFKVRQSALKSVLRAKIFFSGAQAGRASFNDRFDVISAGCVDDETWLGACKDLRRDFQ